MSGRYRLAGTLFASRCDQSALPQSRTQRAGRANGNTQERYGYDAGGARVRKTSGGTTTYTFFAHYEEEATNGATTAISHYSFTGLRSAVKRGSALDHVHGDPSGQHVADAVGCGLGTLGQSCNGLGIWVVLSAAASLQ